MAFLEASMTAEEPKKNWRHHRVPSRHNEALFVRRSWITAAALIFGIVAS